jgi:hypothetical protein
MAVVSLLPTNSYWDNSDGLRVRNPLAARTVTRGGEVYDGAKHKTWVTIALASLPTVASGNKQIVAENVLIPSGAFIEEVQVIVLKEPTDAAGAANLDVGLVDQDRSTEIDFNGFLAAADAFNAGTDLGKKTVYNVGTTEVGALVGTKITNTGILTANAETADWTGGVVRVEVIWSVPLTADL